MDIWADGSDIELEGLVGGDVEMLELGRRLRAARPEPPVDPDFQRRLRAQLMTAAEAQLRPRGLRGLLRPRASLFAYGAGAMGTAMIAAAALAYYAPHSDHVSLVQVTGSSVNAQHYLSPDKVITITFNQAMDRNSVVRGLKFQPALDYYPPSWSGNTLTITPKHDLQANTPYVVSIPKNAARSVDGDVPSGNITITFGTSKVPPVSTAAQPSGPVALKSSEAGVVDTASALGFTSDDTLLATAGLMQPIAPPTGAPGASEPAPPTGAPDAATTPLPALVAYGTDGPVRLGDQVSAVALSPAGLSLATITPDGDHAVVAVSDTDGAHRVVLSKTADPGSPVSWGDAAATHPGAAPHPEVLFLSDGQLTSVDLVDHHVRTIPGVPAGAGQIRFAPGGRYVFVGPAAPPSATPPAPSSTTSPLPPLLPGGVHLGSGGGVSPASSDSYTNAVPDSTTPAGGEIVDLDPDAAVAPLQLTGMAAGALPAFSADGLRVAWIDTLKSQPVIAVQPLDGSKAVVHVDMPTLAPGDTPTDLTLDYTGDRVAFAVSHSDGSADLRLVKVTDGAELAYATIPHLSGLVFSPDGSALAYLQQSGGQTVAEEAPAPGAPTGASSVPPAATRAITSLVQAEVAGDHQALDTLVPDSSVEQDLLAHLPSDLSRGYVISAVPSSKGVVTAQIRLLRDPTDDHPTATFTDQTVTLTPKGENDFQVSSSSIPQPLHDQPIGPQVLQVQTTHLPELTTVSITFDSDLDPSSVNDQVVSLVGEAASGLTTSSVTYDPETRTVVVTILGHLHHPLTLGVSIGLRDVNGQGLASSFQTEVPPGR